ncbi:glutamate receptor 1-like isoform X2 [Corticium candelabrum]|uniref:glutamate receptor 1-like isoform X2 n=1 Tax=Corticium candelabrum TaxID=121492 RepID=UPI002E255317|nr:glutamate receptor 1-like isoform X2 [Corticium candelabrum]
MRLLSSNSTILVDDETGNCSFLDDAVVLHLTSKCLPSDHGVSPPALSLPMRMRIDEYDSRSFIYDLDNGLTSQIAVLSAVAKRLQWKSIGFVTDGSGDMEYASQFFSKAGEAEFRVSFIIRLVEGINVGLVVEKLLALPLDAICVHCVSIRCIHLFYQVANQWMDVGHTHESIWILTEETTIRIRSDKNLRISGFPFLDMHLLGLQRHIEPSHEAIQMLALGEEPLSNMWSSPPHKNLYIYDAVNLIKRVQEENILEMASSHDTLVKEINKLHIKGVTGYLYFDGSTGARVGGQYQVVSINSTDTDMIGLFDGHRSIWSKDLRLPWTSAVRIRRDVNSVPICELNSTGTEIHLRAVAVLEDPWVMLDNSSFSGYKGFFIDVLDELSKRVGFTYSLRIVKDNKYGAINVTGVAATGIMLELVSCAADLGLNLGISSIRAQFIDLSVPVLNDGFALLSRKPEEDTARLFAFLDPFGTYTWICILIAVCVISGMLPILHQLSPYGQQMEETAVDKPYTFKMHRSVWFFCTSFLQLGPEGAKFFSGKILLSLWFLFSMVIAATYTANLAAFMTSRGLKQPIRSVDELSRQTKIMYGTVQDTNVEDFLAFSPIHTYRRMNAYIKNTAGAFVSNANSGFRKAEKGEREYMFIWDELSLEYVSSNEPCTTQIVGNTFGHFGIGFGFPNGMKYGPNISAAIIDMRGLGRLDEYKKKWRINGDKCGYNRVTRSTQTSTKKITLHGVRGLFIVVLATVGLSFIAIIAEWYVWAVKKSREPKTQNSNTVSRK